MNNLEIKDDIESKGDTLYHYYKMCNSIYQNKSEYWRNSVNGVRAYEIIKNLLDSVNNLARVVKLMEEISDDTQRV